MKFIDEVLINVKAGDGGHGLVSFRKERNNPRGGPDGGNGGFGGSVIVACNPSKNTLLEFKYKDTYIAQNGKNGGRNDLTGSNGKDLIIQVPCGTIVKDNESNAVVGEIINKDDSFILEAGGAAGIGNAYFVNSSRQAPDFSKAPEIKKIKTYKLELKLIADIGIIGLPSSGKSTIITKISQVKAKIAAYPFTTLVPNLGVVKYYDKDFIVADVPGLVKNAHLGKGLGLRFLKHIERTKALIHVVDLSSFENPVENIYIINNELKKYSKTLLDKKMLYVLNKIDAKNELYYSELIDYLDTNKLEYIEISAIKNQNIKELIKKMANLL